MPLGRLGTVADVVDGVLYLESASFVTGEFLPGDGGRSAGQRPPNTRPHLARKVVFV